MTSKYTITIADDVKQKPAEKRNMGADLRITHDGRIRVMDVEDPDGIDLLETIRDLIRRIEDLEHGK